MLSSQKKENEDLKYDNTLLYEKNIEKDDKINKLSDDLKNTRMQLDNEKARTTS